MRRTILLTSMLVLFAFAMTACGKDKAPAAAPASAATAIPAPADSAAQEEPAAADTVAAPAAAATPEESTATVSPLVAAGKSPLATPAANSPIPTPTEEVSGMTGVTTAQTGAITGKILISRDGVDIPVGAMIVGLAEVIRDDSGEPRASGYSPDTASKGTTDDGGGFAINEVPPGTYSLILDAVITSYQLESPETGETVLVDVKPGETIDIGVLRYSKLPIPGFNE